MNWIKKIKYLGQRIKVNLKKNNTTNPTDHQDKMWIYFLKKRKYFILHIEDLI